MKFVIKKRQRFVFFPVKKKENDDPFHLKPYVEDAEWGVRIITRERPIAWVKDAKTGRPLRKENAKPLGRGKDGNYYWLKKNDSIYIGDKTFASVWQKGEVPE